MNRPRSLLLKDNEFSTLMEIKIKKNLKKGFTEKGILRKLLEEMLRCAQSIKIYEQKIFNKGKKLEASLVIEACERRIMELDRQQIYLREKYKI